MPCMIVGVVLIAKGSGATGAVINDVDIRAGEVASGDMGVICVTVHGFGVGGVDRRTA